MEELRAVYSKQRGFYGKARTHQVNSRIIDLYSYDTLVCTVNYTYWTITLHEDWAYSNTTLRHVREFLAQCCDERFVYTCKREFSMAFVDGQEIHGWQVVLG